MPLKINDIHYSKISEGIQKCINHSERLISGADELQKQNESANAMCLAIIAQEEIGKAIFLWNHLKKHKDITNKEYKRFFEGKKAHIVKLNTFREYCKKLPQKNLLRICGDALQKFKETGFYVNWENGHWYIFEESELATRVTLITLAFRLIGESINVLAYLQEEMKNYNYPALPNS